MNTLMYSLSKWGDINRWLITERLEENVSTPYETQSFDGDLNRWLTEGFSVFEHPARKPFRELQSTKTYTCPDTHHIALGNTVTVNGKERKWIIYTPWGNGRVEDSGFWQSATHLTSWAFTKIASPRKHEAKFLLSTCGGAVVWINGKLAAKFTPYTRNIEKTTEFYATLEEGLNEIFVCFEELAERDTLYSFRLQYQGADSIEIHLPLQEGIDSQVIYDMEKALEGIYFERDVYTDGDVLLQFGSILPKDVSVEVNYKLEWWWDTPKTVKPSLHGNITANLGKVEELGMGNAMMEISLSYGPIIMKKPMFVQLYPLTWIPKELPESLAKRKEMALSFIAEHGSEDIHRAYALLKTGRSTELIQAILKRELPKIKKRYDCSDFYLNQIFRLWHDFRDAGVLSEDLWKEMEEVILDFRYWFDEPGNDVMWFYSENHALLFHTCELLAGQLFPDLLFTNANITGREHAERAEARLLDWFERFEKEGLAEWNSSAYIPINFMGLLQLYDFAESSVLKHKAKSALDTLYQIMCINSHNGFLACSHGRIYEKELKGNYCNTTSLLLWISYGIGALNNSTYATALCASQYEAPADLEMFARLKGVKELVCKHHQGSDDMADLYTYRTPYGLLASAVEYRPGKNGYSEHVVHATLSPETVVWINHPGETIENGTGRPSYWAGNKILPRVLQYKGFAFVYYHMDEKEEINYTHAYFPSSEMDKVLLKGSWCFGKRKDAYIALYALNGLEWKQHGQSKMRELISKGNHNIWILRISHVEEFPTFEDFVSSMLSGEPFIDQNRVEFYDPIYGKIEIRNLKSLIVNKEEQKLQGFSNRPEVTLWI